jgi:predicted ribosome quality control (RQC) complex YloA/Tae2 family protein
MIKQMFKHELIAFAAFLLIVFTLSGCAGKGKGITEQRILVQSSVYETTRNENVAEVTITPRYSKMASQIKSVALNAPSSCANQSGAAATGTAVGRGDIIKTRCGVEMAEIERALVRQGFTVYSWNMLNSIIGLNMTAIEGAKKLGAQVLFQVNSLERVNLNPGRDTRIVRSFFDSNDDAASLSPLEQDENQIKEIKKAIEKDEKKLLSSKTKLGAMLDVSAVDSETGQSIWFYRWLNQKDTATYVFANFLLHCKPGNCHKGKELNWVDQDSKAPNQDNQKSNSREKRSSEEENKSIDARPSSEDEAEYFNLLKDVTADFVKRFSSGK